MEKEVVGVDREKLKQVLGELKKRYENEWRNVENEILQHFEEIRKIVIDHFQNNKEVDFETAKRICSDHIDKINKLTNPYLLWIWPSPREGFGGSAEEDIENIRNLILNNRITRKTLIVAIDKRTIDDELKDQIKKVLKNVNGVKISTLSSWLCILNPKLFIPIFRHTIREDFERQFSIDPFWRRTYRSESQLDQAVNKFIEFTNTIKKVANELGIDNMIEVAFYLSKYTGNTPEDPIIKKIYHILKEKRQLILYGPPGTGKTWIARNYVKINTNDNRKFYDFVTFHPSYSYEEFVEGIRPKTENGNIYYEVENGIFKRICREAYNELLRCAGINKQWDHDLPELTEDERRKVEERLRNGNYPKFYLVIDEINRGDISRIFGELITLLEADKRLFAENEIIVTLPYSKTKFGVPPNLFIIGTMNTADRSIALIDIALRRRFGFIELMSSYKVLINELGIDNVENEKEAIEKIKSWDENNLNDVKKLAVRVLYTINERIRKLYDRDHQIGHSYLLKLKDCEDEIETLKYIWFCEIIPLLQEYFYDSPEKLRKVLNSEFITVEDESYEFKRMEEFDDNGFINALKRLIRG